MKQEEYNPIQPKEETELVKKTPNILTEQKDNYELDNIDHEIVSKYQPKYLAKGGEHIVYELPGHPNVVVKVATNPLREAINWNVKHEQPIDSLSEELKRNLQEYINQEVARHLQLKKYFGASHVPAQKEFLVNIPITENILNSLYKNNPPAITDKAWSVVMIQKRIEALKNPNRLSVLSGYAPYGEPPKDLINDATEHLVFGKNPEKKVKKEDFFKIKTHGNLKTLLEKSENDENLREAIKELVEKIIRYTDETGEILDIAGQDNIVLYRKDEKWTYKLVDTQFSGENKMIEKTKVALIKHSEGQKIDEQEKHVLHNIFCFVWTINGLAEQVGIEKKINIVPKNINQEEADFLKIIH